MLIFAFAACGEENNEDQSETTDEMSEPVTENSEQTTASDDNVDVTEDSTTEEVTKEEETTEEATTEEVTTEEVTTEEATTEEATTEEVTTEEATTEEVTTEEATTEEVTTEEATTEEVTTEEATTEEETTAAPECNYKHPYWEKNESGHYRNACPYCGQSAELVPHTLDYDDEGRYICLVCKFEPECKGDHWLRLPTGHSMPKCDKCGFEGDASAEAPHYLVLGEDGVYSCDTCGFVPECGGVHEWIKDEYGHAMAACDKCGAAESDIVRHDSSETLRENSDGSKTYTYKCPVCDYKTFETTVPASINYYADLSVMGHYVGNSTVMERYLYDEEADVVYNHITTDSSTHVNITGGEYAGNATADKYEPGKYLIIKYRTYGGRTLEVNIGVDPKNKIALTDANVNDSWVVSVIDLNGLDGYPTEPSQIYIMLLAKAELDVAYAALVDSLDEMRELVSDSAYAYHGPDYKAAPEIRNTADDSLHSHKADGEETVVANDDGSKSYIAKCSDCGYILASKKLPESVCLYNSALTIAHSMNHEAGAIFLPEGYEFKTEIENGIMYTRSSNRQLLWCRSYADQADGKGNQGDRTMDIGASKYLVMTVRSGAKNRSFTINFSTEGKNSPTAIAESAATDAKDINGESVVAGSEYAINSEGISPSITVKMDGEENKWETYVIDLSVVMPSHFVMADGASGYVIDTFYLTWGEDFAESYTDFAAIAFAEDWQAIGSVTDKATVKSITQADGTYSIVNVAEAMDPGSYITGYIGADQIYNRIVNVYPDGNIVDHWYQRVDHIKNKELIVDDPECENGYWRGTADVSATQDIYWNMEATSGTSYVNRTLDAGTARFFVIRMRVNSDGNDSGMLDFYLSTADGENKSMKLPYDNENKGKWVTYVLDMDDGLIENGEKNAWLVKNEDGMCILDEIRMVFKQNAQVDIEYMAFVRGDWANIADLCGEETVVKLTHMNGESYDVVDAATGDKVSE